MKPDGATERDLRAITELDLAIHAPARLMILAYLSVIDSADFTFLLNQTGLTRGNLSSHMGKLEDVGYVQVKKEFVERIPHTLYKLTAPGKKAIAGYKENMQQVLDELLI